MFSNLSSRSCKAPLRQDTSVRGQSWIYSSPRAGHSLRALISLNRMQLSNPASCRALAPSSPRRLVSSSIPKRFRKDRVFTFRQDRSRSGVLFMATNDSSLQFFNPDRSMSPSPPVRYRVFKWEGLRVERPEGVPPFDSLKTFEEPIVTSDEQNAVLEKFTDLVYA